MRILPTLLFAALPFAAHAQDAARGHELFTTIGCSECHGTVGQGTPVGGPRLAPRTPPMGAFLSELRHPVNEMPPYADSVLPDEDAANIHAYLATIPLPTETVSDIPALNK